MFLLLLGGGLIWLGLNAVLPRTLPYFVEAWIFFTIAVLWFWMTIHDGQLARRLGQLGEDWTAGEMWPLTARRTMSLRRGSWTFLRNIDFGWYDVDLVLIGPGGVYAIESKLSALTDDRDEGYLLKAIDQTVENARHIRLLLQWNYEIRTPVFPVLFLWGPGYRDSTVADKRVEIVLGNDVSKWVGALRKSHETLSKEEVAQIASSLRDWMKIRYRHQQSSLSG